MTLSVQCPLLVLIAAPPHNGGREISNVFRLLGIDSTGQVAPESQQSNSNLSLNLGNAQRDILSSLSSGWDDPLPLAPNWIASPGGTAALDRIDEILRDNLGKNRAVLFQDPATCRLLPLWYRAGERLQRRVVTVIPVRHPADTIDSLWYRCGMSRAHALLVWLQSLLAAETASRQHVRAFVEHDKFFADWRTTLQDVATHLDLVWPVDFDHAASRVERELRVAQSSATRLSRPLARGDVLERLAAQAWDAVSAFARDPSDASASASLDVVRTELAHSQSIFGPLVTDLRSGKERTQIEHARFVHAHQQELAGRDAKILEAVKKLNAMEREWDEARSKADSYEQQITELSSKLTRSSADLEEKSARVNMLSKNLERARLEQGDAHRAFQTLRTKCTEEAASKVEKALQELRELQAERDLLNAALHEARQSLAAVHASTSWKVGAPLRALGGAMPAGVRDLLRRSLQKGWRTASPWRNARRRAHAEAALREQALLRDEGLAGERMEGTAVAASGAAVDPEALRVADIIRHSELFDADAYMQKCGGSAQGADPALHYVLYGEERGYAPSAGFDPVYYGERYPDIAAWGGNRLAHFLERGRAEQRFGLPFTDAVSLPNENLDPARPTVLVLLHEASRTGAPILGWNIARTLRPDVNVVSVLLRTGVLVEAFREVSNEVVGPIKYDVFNQADGSRLGRRLAQHYRPLYVIANSVETRSLVPGLASEGVPVVALVHEFSGYTKPVGSLQQLYELAADVVFPAEIVRRSSEADYPFLRLRRSHILPQGPSLVPSSERPNAAALPLPHVKIKPVKERLRPTSASDALLVVGMGFVDWRKGVDLFVGAATALIARDPDAQVRFVWVGHGFKVSDTLDIASYLAEQVERSSLGERFAFLDAVDNVEDVYDEADVLFLSSRLDPLPNVSIDAALRGIPIVCFADASGMAEILASDPQTRELVVTHLDASAAAAQIGRLAADRDKLRQIGDAVQSLARDRFDMKKYVAALDRLGRSSVSAMARERGDAELVLQHGAFDPELFLGASARRTSLDSAVHRYVTQSCKIDYARIPKEGAYTRRPVAGFNPYTYACANEQFRAEGHRDPLASYLDAHRPEGPWAHRVIRLESPVSVAEVPTGLSIILHGHFHYTDHVGDLLNAVAANAHPCRLILTSDSEAKAAEIMLLVQRSGAIAEVRVVENRGRDIGPFLGLLDEISSQCDVVGHIHGKRSLTTENVGVDFGDRWREFLWQHLLGDSKRAMDVIMETFAKDRSVGLVFPEDPHLIGWEENFEIAKMLAERMGLDRPLPSTLDFPVGTMFWARPEALKPLLSLNLRADEYPDEPLPVDGTILHALERLIPFVAEQAGFQFATTFLPTYTR